MTGTTRSAQHPLTDETLVIRNVINETIDSARLDVLRAFRNLSCPTTQTDIANHAEVSRQAVSPHLTVLHERGFINRHDAGIDLTAGGKLLRNSIENCLQTISVDALSFLTRSEHPTTLLQELLKQPYRLTELETAVSDLPSRTTIRRILTDFVNYGWLKDDGRKYRVTSTGSNVLDSYRELVTVVEQLVEKAPLFQRLPVETIPLPVEEFADANLVVANPRSPAAVSSACLNLYSRNISQFRCMCSVYNPVLFHAYRGLLKLGIEAEAILDLPTYQNATDGSGLQALRSDKYSNYQPFVLEESHTLGIGIYDNRKVAIGAYNEVGSGQYVAMIVSSNKRLVDWGIDLYESYRSKARPSFEIRSE